MLLKSEAILPDSVQLYTTNRCDEFCVDGSAIRGLSALFILEQIMMEMKTFISTDNGVPNILRLSNFFDVIGGISTGG